MSQGSGKFATTRHTVYHVDPNLKTHKLTDADWHFINETHPGANIMLVGHNLRGQLQCIPP